MKWTTTACENHQSSKYRIYTTPKDWPQIITKDLKKSVTLRAPNGSIKYFTDTALQFKLATRSEFQNILLLSENWC
jgi:hypothetical protein